MAHGNKTGGREKGTPNRTTKEMRELLQGVSKQYAETQLQADLDAVSPEMRLRFFIELAKLTAPKPPTILGFDRTEQPIFTGIDLSEMEPDAPQHIHITRRVVGLDPQAEQPLFPAPIIQISNGEQGQTL